MKRNHKRYLRSGDLRFAVCCVVLTLLFLPLRRACAKMRFRVVPGFRKRRLIATRLWSADSVRIPCPFLSSSCPQPFGNWAGTS
mgnify:CR=1 FL=1